MFDLLYLAYRADITRVSAFQIGRELSLRSYPELGIPGGHHEVSHHANNPEKIAMHAKINTHHLNRFSHLVGRLAETPGRTLRPAARTKRPPTRSTLMPLGQPRR